MTAIVDSRDIVDEQPSIALDSESIPHIAYYDGRHDDLLYATKASRNISASIDIDPDTLNLKSKGKFITAYIELEGADVRDIDASSIRLNDIVSPLLDERYGFVASEDSYIVDHDEDGVPERMVKFWRSDVQKVLDVGSMVTITLSGHLDDDTPFKGTDEIRVIVPSELNWPNLAVIDAGFPADLWGPVAREVPEGEISYTTVNGPRGIRTGLGSEPRNCALLNQLSLLGKILCHSYSIQILSELSSCLSIASRIFLWRAGSGLSKNL
jgi:hypothetical protein